jgi:hypothetical protein
MVSVSMLTDGLLSYGCMCCLSGICLYSVLAPWFLCGSTGCCCGFSVVTHGFLWGYYAFRVDRCKCLLT